jgi:hypothetical protein
MSENPESPQEALSRIPCGALTNARAVSPFFLNPAGFKEYKGAVYMFIV